jgi:phosphate transport system permease protein
MSQDEGQSDEPWVGEVPSRDSARRAMSNRWFQRLCIVIAALSVTTLAILLASILVQGIPAMSADLILNPPGDDPADAGIWPAMWGTVWVCGLCALITLPIGVATAILLEEFPPRSRAGRVVHSLIQLNISNLAGVPSIVYGILGLTAFVTMFGQFSQPGSNEPALEIGVQHYYLFMSEADRAINIPVESADAPPPALVDDMRAYDTDLEPIRINVIEPGDELPEDEATLQYTIFSDSEGGPNPKPSWYYFRLPFGRGVLAGALTLMLVILPIVIISSQEALRAVPSSLRAGALGLGATQWQVIWNVTLPASIPGIMTGSILSMSRAIGEAAPLLILSGVVFIRFAPKNLMDEFTVMPLQIYNWAGRPQDAFQDLAGAAIILLLIVLLSFNAIAVFIRQKLQKPLS